MKIAVICPYDFSRPGGVQAHIRDLSQELRKNHSQVTVVAPNITRSKEDLDCDSTLRKQHFSQLQQNSDRYFTRLG